MAKIINPRLAFFSVMNYLLKKKYKLSDIGNQRYVIFKIYLNATQSRGSRSSRISYQEGKYCL